MIGIRLFGLELLVLVSASFAQDNPTLSVVVHRNQEIRVSGLPSLRAESKDASDVLATALATILHYETLCCERDSALEGRMPQSDPVSLKEVASKLQGRQLLNDGRPIQVNAEYMAAASVNGRQLIRAIIERHAPLMEWNSHLFVVYGAIYDEAIYSDGSKDYAIHKLLLLDTRYSDSRRNVAFNRDTDDWNEVQGVLFLTFAAQ